MIKYLKSVGRTFVHHGPQFETNFTVVIRASPVQPGAYSPTVLLCRSLVGGRRIGALQDGGQGRRRKVDHRRKPDEDVRIGQS